MDDIMRIDLVDIELNNGSLHRSWLNRSIGSGDAKANGFGVRVFRNGEPVSLSGGSVQGYFRNSQGENIALTSGNTVDGNVAYVVMPQACYNYEGQFTLAIKVINSSAGETGTMRIVDGTVDNTNSGGAVAPTGTVPTYQEVLAIYGEMVETVADYEDVVANQDQQIDDLKSALSSEDIFVNDTLSYINYGYDEPYYKAEDPSSSSYNNKIGIKRDRMVVVLNKSTLSQSTARVRISGAVAFAATNSGIDAWTSGLTLEGGHTYRAVTKLISGTSSAVEQGDGLVPGISVYKCGTHSGIGEFTTRVPGLTVRTFTIDETGQYNLAIYIGSAGTYFTNAKLLITLEDVTESKIVHIEEQITEIDENMYRMGESLDHLFYTEEISFNTSDWRTGYYGKSNGDFVQSNLYICTASNFTISKSNATRLTAKAPDGYFIAVYEYDGNGVFVKRYGDQKGTNAVDIIYTDGNNYRLTVGRFNNLDSGDYITSEFIGQIKVSVEELKLPDADTKKDRTGDFEWFTVNVDRPLAFGGEEVIDPQEEQEIECVLRLPTSYTRSGTPTRLVLACHGASGYIQASRNKWYTDYWKDFMNTLLDAGYAVFDANVLPTSTGTEVMGRALGSPLYVNILKKAYDYIVSNYNVYEKIFAHGTSMGGVGASAFTNAYPQIVLAESSFAGRDLTQYIYQINTGVYAGDDDFAKAWGYEDLAELNADKWSHIDGCAFSLTLLKYTNGVLEYPPDRETAYSDWLTYYGEVQSHGKDDPIGQYIAHRAIPYKAWDSWNDNIGRTKAKLILQKAFTAGSSVPYEVVVDDEWTHTELSYGISIEDPTRINTMREQLIAWFKRWE